MNNEIPPELAEELMEAEEKAPEGAPEEYERALDGTAPRPLADIIYDLRRPIHPRLWKTKLVSKKTGVRVTYVPWPILNKLVDHYTRGYWNYAVTSIEFDAHRIYVTVRVTIHGIDGTLHRDAVGTEFQDSGRDPIVYGDPSSNAVAMAFRRALARWMLGLDFWIKEDDE